jgi:hypothetical protein
MDPLLTAFANQYGLVWGVVVILGGGFIANLIRVNLIPYWVEQQKAKQEREDRILKAFEENARTNVELAHAIQGVSKNQEQAAGVLSGVATNVAILVSRKRNPPQGVGGD